MQEQQISLYLDLLQGQKPSVAVVARATIAFEEAVRQIALDIDPFSGVRLEYHSATESSLSINAVIRPLQKHLTRRNLILVAGTVAGWLAADLRSYLTEKAIEEALPPEVVTNMSDDDIRKLGVEIATRIKQDSGGGPIRQIYRELEPEPAVSGVGVSYFHGHRPLSLVPKADFSQRAEPPEIAEPPEGERVRTEISDVILVSPVLVEANRRWKFRSEAGEFGAPVRDREFLERFLSGQANVPMASGIRMRVEMEIREERRGELWEPRERTILKVLHVSPAPHQPSFELPP